MRAVTERSARVTCLMLICCLFFVTLPAYAADERTFADLKVNDSAAGEALVTILADDLLVPVAALKKAGLHGFLGKRVSVGAEENVSLRSLAPDFTYVFDQDQTTVAITAKLSYLGTSSFNLAQTASDLQISNGAGSGYLNYALTHQAYGDDAFSGEFGVNQGPGVLLGSFHDDRFNGLRRDQTRYVIDDAAHARRLTLGDSDVNAGFSSDPLAGSASIGGITLAHESAFNPNAVRASASGLTGTASSPSTVDVFVNGALALHEDVAPGSFSFQNLPLTEGQNNAQVVIRDAFGRTQTVDQQFYMATELLAAGATEYAFSLGALHDPYSGGASYGPAAALAHYAIGVRNDLTLGARLEAQPDLLSTGATLGLRTRLGLFGAAAALSNSGGLRGYAGDFSYAYAARKISISADLRGESASYATVSQGTEFDRALREARIGISTSLGMHALTLSYLTQTYRDALLVHSETSLSDTVRLGNFGLTIAPTLYRNGTLFTSGVVMNLTTMLGRTTQVALGTNLNSGTLTRTLDITNAARPSGGIGYQIDEQAQAGAANMHQETVTYRNRYGIAEASLDGTRLSSLGLSGGLAFVDHTAVFTQPISGSFGLIESGVPGVGATVNSQYLGRTDTHGNIFVPNLFPFVRNQVDLDAEDAPLNNQLVDPHRTIVPRAGAGVAIRLESRRVQAYTGIVALKMPDGNARIPADGALTLHRHGTPDSRSDLGEDGAYYFEYLIPGSYNASIVSAAGTCSFDFHVDPTRGPLTRMGVQSCTAPHS